MMDFKDECEVRILRMLFENPYILALDKSHYNKDLMFSLLDKFQNTTSEKLHIYSAQKLIEQIVISPYAHNNFIKTAYDIIPQIINRDAPDDENVYYPGSIYENTLSGLMFDIVESSRENWIKS